MIYILSTFAIIIRKNMQISFTTGENRMAETRLFLICRSPTNKNFGIKLNNPWGKICNFLLCQTERGTNVQALVCWTNKQNMRTMG